MNQKREIAASWTYWILFLLLPLIGLSFGGAWVGIPKDYLVPGILVLIVLSLIPSEVLYRWWRIAIWKCSDEPDRASTKSERED